MGNSLVPARLIALIKTNHSLPRVPRGLPNKLPNPVKNQLIPSSRVTALIPYIMPPTRVRVTKAAASTKSKPNAEKVSNDEGDNDTAEMSEEVKKPVAKGKKKPSTENGSEEKQKSTSGRTKAEVQEDNEEPAEAPKASGRGRKKVVAVENPPEEASEPKKSRGRKKDVPVPSGPSEASEAPEEPEEAPKKASRGRKKVETIDNEDQEKEPKPRSRKKAESVEPASEPDKKPARGRKKGSAKESSEEPEGEPDKPAKRGRKPKLNSVEETEEKAEKLPAKRARKPVAKVPEDEEEDEEKPVKRGRKPANTKELKEGNQADEPVAKKAKTEEKKRANKVDTNLDEIDFDCDKTNARGDKSNLRICSWNVGGIRSVTEKKGVEYCRMENADIIVLQETKCKEGDLPPVWELPGYLRYCADSEKPGYAGVTLFTKMEPLDVKVGLETSPCNDEGRIITAEFEKFYVVAVYVPNAGRGLVTMDKRLAWNTAFKKHVQGLDKKKPVIVCGDMNVAHEEIDLANPKTNTKHAGFTKEEREGMTNFLGAGFVDTFRQLYPDQTGAYSFWSYLSNARSKNVGWRLDYFIVSERIKDHVCDNIMRTKVYGSDHCPIVLFANL